MQSIQAAAAAELWRSAPCPLLQAVLALACGFREMPGGKGRHRMTEPLKSLPPLESWEQLKKVLQEEMAFDGCDSCEELIYLLRNVLRCARDRLEAMLAHDEERFAQARVALLEQLGYEKHPVLASWLLHWLDHYNLVYRSGSCATICELSPRGSWLLDALERLYPPPEFAEA
jgi:hypothetical protein